MITETKQKAALAVPESGAEELIELINSRVKPNQPMKETDVIVRKMFLVSDRINSFGGRFDQKELLKMAELVIDSLVLVGHNHQKLLIGRNFKAEIAEKNGAVWLATHFYWLTSALGAENLAKNIDGGIYKEVSAAFLFEMPECSICGRDIRSCEHIPFRRYAAPSGSLQPAFFWYRNVLQGGLRRSGPVQNLGPTRLRNLPPAVAIQPHPNPLRPQNAAPALQRTIRTTSGKSVLNLGVLTCYHGIKKPRLWAGVSILIGEWWRGDARL